VNRLLKQKTNRKPLIPLTMAIVLMMAALAGCAGQSASISTATPAATVEASPTGSSTASAGPTDTPAPSAAPTIAVSKNVTLKAFPAVWCPAVSSSGFIHLNVVDENGNPVKGDWSTTRGAFILLPFLNPDGSTSKPDQQPAKELKGLTQVGWLLPEAEQKEGGSIELRFTQQGNSTVLLLAWDSDMGLMSIGERLVAFSADEVRVIKGFSALVKDGKPTSELLTYVKGNIGKLNNGLGEVLADGVVNALENNIPQFSNDLSDLEENYGEELAMLEGMQSFTDVQSTVSKALAAKLKPLYDNGYMVRFQDGQVCPDIRWNDLSKAFAGKEGECLGQYTKIISRESDTPFVVDGTLEVTTDELAQRYIDARAYAAAWPFMDDWHYEAASYKDFYLSSLLTLNGALYSGDDFSVPQDQQAAYDTVIAKYASDDLGKMLAEYKALLVKNSWKLTDEIRDFLTGHNVPGYGRLE
jgi:hypothetical protein